jgi:hypothetical protein
MKKKLHLTRLGNVFSIQICGNTKEDAQMVAQRRNDASTKWLQKAHMLVMQPKRGLSGHSHNGRLRALYYTICSRAARDAGNFKVWLLCAGDALGQTRQVVA